jgi:hypothetical protein
VIIIALLLEGISSEVVRKLIDLTVKEEEMDIKFLMTQ